MSARILFSVALFGVMLPQSNVRATDENPVAKTTGQRNVAIVIHDAVELLDFAGPAEVFWAANKFARVDGKPAFNVYGVAPSAEPITTAKFLKVVPEYTIANCPAPDILVVPGGQTNVLIDDAEFMVWVNKAVDRSEIAFSVCSGAMVFAKGGHLKGREATTHWGVISSLRKAAPDAKILSNVRFVDSGRIVTSAGISAGIDGALHLVARLFGRIVADRTARHMEYDWRPSDEDIKTYARLFPKTEALRKLLAQARAAYAREDWSAAAQAYQEAVEIDSNDAEVWWSLGYALHMMRDFDKAIEAYTRAETIPHSRKRSLSIFNQACVYGLMGDASSAAQQLAKMKDSSWMGPATIDADSDFDRVRTDPEFQRFMTAFRASHQ